MDPARVGSSASEWLVGVLVVFTGSDVVFVVLAWPAATLLRMSAEEYVQVEKHELHVGQVFAMAGGSQRHDALAVAMSAELCAVLRGGP